MENIIEKAVNHYAALLKSQIERNNRIKENTDKTDFSKKEKIIIGICDGDGIGPVIMENAVLVLEKILENEIKSGKISLVRIDGLTLENRQKCGKAIPDDVLKKLKKCDVILKGPTATPHGGTLESANVCMRRELDLFANVRPVKIPHEGIDWTFFRENSEGEYILGSSGLDITPEIAMDFKVTTIAGTKRIARAAFEYAKQNGKKNVAIVTKANIMKHTDGLFSRIAHEVAADYPDIKTEDWYIDIMTANLINPDIRNRFEVILLPNLYGDIITDEAAQIKGGVGTAGSANIGDKYAMFEAIHGTAPRMIEEGLENYANPSSILQAEVMMLRHIKFTEKAEKLEKALFDTINTCRMTGDSRGHTGKEFTEKLLSKL